MISHADPRGAQLGILVMYGTSDSGKERLTDEIDSVNMKVNINMSALKRGRKQVEEIESLMAQ